MSAKKEQAIVGLFVVIATGLLLTVVFLLTGILGSAVANSYTASFKNAGGLEPGATVRYQGGPKVGRVEQLRIDPHDPQRIEVRFSVASGVPVKADTKVKIAAISALGENYLELIAGADATAPNAPSGTRLQSQPYFGISDLSELLRDVGPKADALLSELKGRAVELKETITRVNDVLNQENRANLQASLGQARGMLEENRPRVKNTLAHIEGASAKIAPLLDDFKKAVADADRAVNNMDALLLENRADVREAVKQLKTALASASGLTDQLNRTLVTNSDNIDEMLENMRLTTQNLKQFTDTIKARPASLIRSPAAPDRKPGEAPRKN
jgi:phospholipid/cholesterol/gamma-HCH transport system substrate-binding protein